MKTPEQLAREMLDQKDRWAEFERDMSGDLVAGDIDERAFERLFAEIIERDRRTRSEP